MPDARRGRHRPTATGQPCPWLSTAETARGEGTTAPPPAAVTQQPSRRLTEWDPAHVHVHGEKNRRARGSRSHRLALLCCVGCALLFRSCPFRERARTRGEKNKKIDRSSSRCKGERGGGVSTSTAQPIDRSGQ